MSFRREVRSLMRGGVGHAQARWSAPMSECYLPCANAM